jgi:multiple sugar transport system permease protein
MKSPGERRDVRFALLLNVPALLVVTALIAYPVLYSFRISLYRYNLRQPGRIRFIGLRNYTDILADPLFWHSLGVTLYFAALSVVTVLVLALGIALLLNEPFRGRGLARALLLVPWAVPGVVNGLMWRGFFGKYGGLNALRASLGWPDPYQSWLVDPSRALHAAIAAHVWKEIPFAAILFLAALQAIPPEQHRAARVDGASPLRRFVHITLPWLWHAVLIIAIFETMVSFRAFDLIFTLTGGGPGRATHVIAWQTYTVAFRFVNFGLANAYSYLIALITMSLSFLYIRVLYQRGQVQG